MILLSFCYHKRLSDTLPATVPLYCSLFFFTLLNFQATEKPQKHKVSGVSYVWTQRYLAITIYIILSDNQWLLDDCSNTAWSNSTSTFTLPVLDLSLSSTMLFVDFMLFLGTTYIMYFYFPKLLEPFWSHLNSSTSTSICLSFYCNNSYENWKFQAL